jgi:hypothetical protein
MKNMRNCQGKIDEVSLLDCIKKRTNQTSHADMERSRGRLKAIKQELKDASANKNNWLQQEDPPLGSVSSGIIQASDITELKIRLIQSSRRAFVPVPVNGLSGRVHGHGAHFGEVIE